MLSKQQCCYTYGFELYASGERARHYERDERKSAPSVAQLVFKCPRLLLRSRTIVRGFGFLQAVHPLYQVQGQVQLEMLLRPLSGLKADQDHQHTFDILWRAEKERARFTAPFSLETSFPHAQTADHYQLHVGGFLQHVIFTPKVFSCLPPVSRPSPAIITVLPHSHTHVEDPRHLELITQMLIWHVRHHLKLGLAGTVHYEVEPFLSKLSSNPQIHLLIQQGSLRLIAWDSEVQGYMPNGLVWHKNSAKTLQYNHAVLAHWGLGVYLNPMDIDEFMASEKPRSIAQLLQSDCIVPGGQTLLYRYDVRCGSCTEGESQVWLSNRSNPLAKYNETDWKVRLRGKPILYADTSYSMAIHESGDWHGGVQHYKQCMFHIHLVNLFAPRRGTEDDAQFRNDTSWDWLV